jgi:ubiquitin-protein ligase
MSSAVRRVLRDLAQFRRDDDVSLSGVAILPFADDVTKLAMIIAGPADTPYAHGVYLFRVKVGNTYPFDPPHVTLVTTDGGRTRLNPNLYAGGKVCMTILGTWEDAQDRKTGWTPGMNLGIVGASVRSLFSEDPLHNEPQYEGCSSTLRSGTSFDVVGAARLLAAGEAASCDAYALRIRHESLRIAVLLPLLGALVGYAPGAEDATRTELVLRHWKRWSAREANTVCEALTIMLGAAGAASEAVRERWTSFVFNALPPAEITAVTHECAQLASLLDGTPGPPLCPFELAGNCAESLRGVFEFGKLGEAIEEVAAELFGTTAHQQAVVAVPTANSPLLAEHTASTNTLPSHPDTTATPRPASSTSPHVDATTSWNRHES